MSWLCKSVCVSVCQWDGVVGNFVRIVNNPVFFTQPEIHILDFISLFGVVSIGGAVTLKTHRLAFLNAGMKRLAAVIPAKN